MIALADCAVTVSDTKGATDWWDLGVPDPFRDGVDEGWYEFYWNPMKAYFGEK